MRTTKFTYTLTVELEAPSDISADRLMSDVMNGMADDIGRGSNFSINANRHSKQYGTDTMSLKHIRSIEYR